MDADKVLALAIEAGFSHACWTDKGMKHWRGTRTDLNRFADLIEQAKEKQMIAEGWRSPEQVKKAVEDEREACAAYVAVEWGEIDIAEAIRSRSNQE